ncbi:MAG TPA: S41 family peptidase [Longimicrobium sp.]|nr:S41 family peptidase [Longimicrobium sp.]
MNPIRMRIFAPAAALLLASPLGAQSADTLPVATRERIVSELDRNVKRYFAHWEAVPDLDYPREFAAYRARAVATADRRAFDLAAMEFMAGLRNGHTGYGDQWLWERDGAPLPLRLARVEGRWAVLWSRVEGVRAGDVVESIDGESFEDFFRRNRRYVAGSSERAVRYMFGTRSFLFPPRFTLRLAGGRDVAVVRQRAASSTTPPSAPRLTHRWLVPDSVGYLRVPSFGDGAYQAAALDLLQRDFRGASALVVDLRGNGGGSTPWKLRKALMGGFRHRSRRDGPDKVRPSIFYRMAIPVVLKLYPVPTFRGDLVFLVDGGCASACEDLLLQFKDNGRAVLVGDTTFGSTGQPRFLDLGGGITAQVSARRVRFPDGAPFEGVGVAPDVYLPVTLDGLRAGSDPLPERALALIRSGAARYPRRAQAPPHNSAPPPR